MAKQIPVTVTGHFRLGILEPYRNNASASPVLRTIAAKMQAQTFMRQTWYFFGVKFNQDESGRYD